MCDVYCEIEEVYHVVCLVEQIRCSMLCVLWKGQFNHVQVHVVVGACKSCCRIWVKILRLIYGAFMLLYGERRLPHVATCKLGQFVDDPWLGDNSNVQCFFFC